MEVGIITVKKAYEVLLKEELIYSKGAVGYFVNVIDIEAILIFKKEEYLEKFKNLIDAAINDGLQIPDIKDILKITLEDK